MHTSLPSGGGSGGGFRTAFLLNLVFTGLELVAGSLTNSMAILSDAVHDLGDALALGLSWYLESYAGRAGDVRDLTTDMSLEHATVELEFESEECGMRPPSGPAGEGTVAACG